MASRLYLLGLGVEPREHATIEVLQAIGFCDALFAVGLTPAQRRFLKPFCRGGAAPAAAAAGAAPVGAVLRALEAGKTVGLATTGHPFFRGPAAALLVAECEKRKIEWQTFGAVSAMGLAIAQAGVTLGTTVYGLQSFDGSALAERPAAVNPVWPLVVYFQGAPGRPALQRLLGKLRETYPERHEVLWCSVSKAPVARPLSELARRAREVSASTVLFLGAAKPFESLTARTDACRVPAQLPTSAWVKD